MIRTELGISIDVDNYGGTIKLLQINDKHILLPQQVLKEDGLYKKRGGSHLCFPNFGPPKNSRWLNLPQHGFVRDSLFELDEDIYESTYSNKLLKFNSKFISESKFNFPAFELKQFLGIEQNIVHNSYKLIQQVTIEHASKYSIRPSIPIGLGIHPYFYCPEGMAHVSFNHSFYDYTISSSDISFHRIFKREYLDSNEILITIPGYSETKMTVSELFTESKTAAIVTWRNHPSYICVEPVVCMPEKFGKNGSPFLLKSKDYVSASCTFDIKLL